MSSDEVARLKRRLMRERTARKQAEQLLEEKSLALFVSNQDLRKAHDELEKRVEERTRALFESEEKFRRFIEMATDVIYQTDTEGYFTYANPVALKILKLGSEEEIIGRRYTKLVHPDDRNDLASLYQKQHQEKISDTYQEFRLNTSQKQPTWIGQNVQLIYDDEHEIIGFQAVARDITTLKVTQSQLKAQRDFAEQILNNMGQGLTLTNAESLFVYVNPAMATMLGYDLDELINQSLLNFIHPDDVSKIMQTDGTRTVESPFTHEIRFLAKNGRIVPTLITGVARWHDGEIIGYIDTIADLTERKQMEHALREARDRALEASRLQAAFLANMSHEIRTPLNGVLGMTELLGMTDLDEEQEEYIDIINTSGSALLAIINNILDFSKIAKGKVELEHHPFSLKEMVEDSLDVLASKAAQKRLELAYLMGEDVPTLILGDVVRLRQIIINLLSNAVKFTASGEISLTIGLHKNEANLSQLKFAVRDTGIGISSEHQSKLFQAFYQTDSSTTRHYGGTGLGLAISKELSNLMGGEMWVESEENVGTTFHFTINYETPPNYQLQPAPVELKSKKLLIIGNHEINHTVLLNHTERWNMQSEVATSGQAALDCLQHSQPFDAIIVDLPLTDMRSDDLAAEIRKQPNANTIPLILLSPIGQKLEEQHRHLITNHLTKPIKPTLLRRSLIDACQQNLQVDHIQNVDQDSPDTPRISILLAEDNEINRIVIQGMMTRLGYATDIAHNGREAITALENQFYDLILMDIQMPEMDGMEASRYIRKHFSEEHQPFIVALTASAIQGDRERFIAAGMNEYISKPVHMDDLAQLVQRFSTT